MNSPIIAKAIGTLRLPKGVDSLGFTMRRIRPVHTTKKLKKMISHIKQVTVESVLQRTNFLLILRTVNRFKAFRSREVLAVNLDQAIASAKVDLEDVLEAYILIDGSWFAMSSIASLEGKHEA